LCWGCKNTGAKTARLFEETSGRVSSFWKRGEHVEQIWNDFIEQLYYAGYDRLVHRRELAQN